jgi:hypothetical protein
MARKKMILGGYETWVERPTFSTVILYDTETSKFGLPIDVFGSDEHICILDKNLTLEERKELKTFLLENVWSYQK